MVVELDICVQAFRANLWILDNPNAGIVQSVQIGICYFYYLHKML